MDRHMSLVRWVTLIAVVAGFLGSASSALASGVSIDESGGTFTLHFQGSPGEVNHVVVQAFDPVHIQGAQQPVDGTLEITDQNNVGSNLIQANGDD
jgi:hypothetical protein